YPRKQLVELERLRKIIVGSAVETGNDLFGCAERCKHENGSLDLCLAKFHAQGTAVHYGHDHIGDDKAVVISESEMFACPAIFGSVYTIRVLFKALLDHVKGLRLILDQQNIHHLKATSRFYAQMLEKDYNEKGCPSRDSPSLYSKRTVTPVSLPFFLWFLS